MPGHLGGSPIHNIHAYLTLLKRREFLAFTIPVLDLKFSPRSSSVLLRITCLRVSWLLAEFT